MRRQLAQAQATHERLAADAEALGLTVERVATYDLSVVSAANGELRLRIQERRRLNEARERFESLKERAASLALDIDPVSGDDIDSYSVGARKAEAQIRDRVGLMQRFKELSDAVAGLGGHAGAPSRTNEGMADQLDRLQNLAVDLRTKAQLDTSDLLRGQRNLPWRDALLEKAARCIEDLPAQASVSVSERAGELFEALRIARDEHRAEATTRTIGDLIRAEAQRLQRCEATRLEIEALLVRLDGCPGGSAAELRGRLRSHPLDQGIEERLRSQVDAAEEEWERLQDERYVLETLRDVMRELGVSCPDDFVVAAADGSAIVGLPGSQLHGVRVRARSKQSSVFLDPVVFDKDASDHAQAQEEWCSLYASIAGRMKSAGHVKLQLVSHVPAGEKKSEFRSAPAHVIDAARRGSSQAAPKERTVGD